MKAIILLILFSLLLSCGKHEPAIIVLPIEIKKIPQYVNDPFELQIEKIKKVDILWVIDNSNSMRDEQIYLGTNFSNFINYIISSKLDFHIGVITTDDDDIDGQGKLVKTSEMIVPYLDNQTPNINDAFRRISNVGIGGYFNEKGLTTSLKAISPNLTQSGKPNEGFFRNDATLIVIVLSDEDDDKEKTSSISPQTYVNQMKSFKGNKDLGFLFYGIVAVRGNQGNLIPSFKYLEVSKLLGTSPFDITNINFGQHLSRIGEDLVRSVNSYPLKLIPQPDTIKVLKDNRELPKSHINGWSYIPERNAIKLSGSFLYKENGVIDVTYIPQE